jgi:hypothetical protein
VTDPRSPPNHWSAPVRSRRGDLSRLEFDVVPPKPVATGAAPGEVSLSPKLTAINLPENLQLCNMGVGARAAHARNFSVTDVQIRRATGE